jgi:hypothetical protein
LALYVEEQKKKNAYKKEKVHSAKMSMTSMMNQFKKTPLRNPLNLRRPESALNMNRVQPHNDDPEMNINNVNLAGTFGNIPTISVSDEYYPRYAWLD